MLDLLQAYGLGHLLGEPIALSGGRTHLTWKIHCAKNATSNEAYFVLKQLSSSQDLDRIKQTEAIARFAQEQGCPAVPALLRGHSPICFYEGQHYLLFPFVEG